MFPTTLQALQATLTNELIGFSPELAVVGTILLLLLVRLFPVFDRTHLIPLAAIGCGAALALTVPNFEPHKEGLIGGTAFTGLIAADPFAAVFRAFVLTTTLCVLALGWATGLPDREDSADFGVLVLGAALGMMLMASANHLLMIFLAVEMASLPSYALAGFLKGKPKGSEAALKYVVFGAAASGVMLYGISLLVARCGTGLLPAVGQALAAEWIGKGGWDVTLVAGVLFLLVGLGYKLSLVPFHFWLPDAFEGAAAEIGAFLSIASKAAAFGLLTRLIVWLSADPTVDGPHGLSRGLQIAAAVTATVGNLAAYGQTNLKRLLGYSTIAHAGYMLMAVAPLGRTGAEAMMGYLVAYLPANLGAFAVVAAVRNRTGSEDVAAVRGLISRSPILGLGFAISLMSLLGLPPLAGFAAKFHVFSAIYETGNRWLVIVGVINTVISAGYYLKLLRTIGLEESDDKSPMSPTAILGGLIVLCTVATVALGILWDPVAGLMKLAVDIRH